MNLYFSCSLTGGRSHESTYGSIVDHLLSLGHEVPTAHLARPEVMSQERVIDPDEVYVRDTTWVRECDALIAEVSTPSHGVGYEIAYALQHAKPVLCCYQAGAKVSKMITGNHSPGMEVRSYTETQDALGVIDRFLARLERHG